MTPDALLDLCARVADAIRVAVAGIDARALLDPGVREGQYHLDLVADAAALEVLHAAGVGVVSEESGFTGNPASPIEVVLDPVDGSTNCSRGIPLWGTAIGVRVDGDVVVGYVCNQTTGTTWTARRGGGAFRDGVAIRASETRTPTRALLATEGLPPRSDFWQFRALGSAAIDMCMVADGSIDGAIVPGGIYVWDYLGAQLICEEAGAVVAEATGASLIDAPHGEKRWPLVAGTAELLEVLRPIAKA